MSNELAEARALILVSEYTALRAELMFFIQMQRQNMNFLLTTAFGQILGLAFIGYDKIDPILIIYFYLFAVPFLIGLLMLMSLENTAKIIVVASYIATNLRKQLRPFFVKENDYFLWEHHKKQTNRVNRKVLVLLDRSKWFVFVAGLALSMGLAVLVQQKTQALVTGIFFSHPISFGGVSFLDQFLFSALLVLFIIGGVFNAARYFSEAEGEEARLVMDALAPLPPAPSMSEAAEQIRDLGRSDPAANTGNSPSQEKFQ